MNLDFKKAAESSKTSKYLTPGVYDNIVITEITPVLGDKPYLAFKFTKSDGEGALEQRLYLTEGAIPFTLAKLKELVEATGQTLPEETNTDVVCGLLTNKAVALRIFGKEVQTEKGIFVRSELGSSPFCAPAGQASRLTFNVEKNIKRLTPQPAEASTGSDSTDDLPF